MLMVGADQAHGRVVWRWLMERSLAKRDNDESTEHEQPPV